MNDEPEFRRDPVTGRWAVVAPARAARPVALADSAPRRRAHDDGRRCPFCPGAEHETPPEVYALRPAGTAPDAPGWRLRVVPNMYPAVSFKREREPEARNSNPDSAALLSNFDVRISCLSAGRGVGLLAAAPAVGFAEVLIECAEHLDNPTQLAGEQLADVFRAYRTRMLALAADPRIEHVAVFKNVGAEAGASLAHSHSQLIATPVVPDLIRAELAGAEAYFARCGRCVFCDLIGQELADGVRVVARSAHFVAVTAFAPRFAYEMWVLPIAHKPRYEALTDGAAAELATLVKRVLRALDAVQGAPAYNWFLHTTPLRAGAPEYYHWHLEVLPRTARPAGFEWGYGCHITTASPERAAADLRAALPQ